MVVPLMNIVIVIIALVFGNKESNLYDLKI